MLEFLVVLLIGLAWVGHACSCTAVLNNLYGRRLPKTVLKPVRFLAGFAIVAFPLVLAGIPNLDYWNSVERRGLDPLNGWLGRVLLAYCVACLYFGTVFPMITLERYLRKPPACIVSEQTRTLDLWPELGQKLVGDGKFRPLTRVPGNGVFKLDITDLTLALPNLPPEWDGLTILHVTDLHFHGTPSREYFDRIFAELIAGPVPDLICLTGDFVDTDKHREWIQPLLGRLQAKEANLAILGNHDEHHDPTAIRAELTAAGYTVLSNTWREIAIRGVPCVAVGHEGPWFDPAPDLTTAPKEPFRLCLSHTPDNFYWGQSHGIGLMLCGHVHGGGIRVPVIGSIFVPSIYGRRFDQGVFEENGATMVVSRGVSGKEPIRIRCNPQVIRIRLTKKTEAAR
jgi:predicted MPP superfamily phosphohydrolase